MDIQELQSLLSNESVPFRVMHILPDGGGGLTVGTAEKHGMVLFYPAKGNKPAEVIVFALEEMFDPHTLGVLKRIVPASNWMFSDPELVQSLMKPLQSFSQKTNG